METEFTIIITAIVIIVIAFILGCKVGKLEADKDFENELLDVVNKAHSETKEFINNYEKSKGL